MKRNHSNINPGKKIPQILIVDDEQNLLDSLSFTLKRRNYRPVTCSNGLLALELVKDAQDIGFPFDLIITDIQLPGLNGLDLIDAVKKISDRTPFIAISNYGNRGLASELNERGISAYLDKPFSTQKLIKCIEKILTEKSNTL